MATISTPYKNGTIAGVNGTAITLSVDLVSEDIGRVLVITNGTAINEYRRIISVNGKIATVAHEFNATNFVKFTDVPPEINATCSISYKPTDTQLATSLTLTDRRVDIASLTLTAGVYIHFEGYNIFANSDNIKISRGNGIIFGFYKYKPAVDAYPENSCTFTDAKNSASGNTAPWSNNWGNFGMLDFYGGAYFVNNIFVALFDSVNLDEQVRFFNVNIYGNFGGRVGGRRSLFVVNSFGNNSNTGVINLTQEVKWCEISCFGGLQAAYSFLQLAPRSAITFPALNDLERVIYVAVGTASSSNETVTIKAPVPAVNAVSNFLVVSGTANNHKFNLSNDLDVSFILPDLSEYSDEAQVVIRNSAGSVVHTETVTNGKITQQELIHTTVPTQTGARRLEDGTQLAPYTLTARAVGKLEVVQIFNMQDTTSSKLIFFKDNNYSNTTVPEAGSIIPANELYDILRRNIASDSTLPDDLISVVRSKLIIKTGWTLKAVVGGSGATLSINKTTKIITVKLSTDGLLKTDKFDTLGGNIDASLEGNTDMLYVKPNGTISVTLNGFDPESFNHGLSGVLYRKASETSYTKQIVSTSTGTLSLLPNTDYVFRVLSAGYNEKTFSKNTGVFGFTENLGMLAVKDLDGINLYSKSVNQLLLNSSTFDSATSSILVTEESGTDQIVYDFNTAYRVLENITHSPALLGGFANPVVVSPKRNSLIVPLGNYFRMTVSENTPRLFISFKTTRPDGTSVEVGAIKKLDGSDLTDASGNKVYHYGLGITLLNEANEVTITTPASVLEQVVSQIPAKVDEATKIESLNSLLVDAQDGTGKALSAEAVENIAASTGGTGGFTATDRTALTAIHTATEGKNIAEKSDIQFTNELIKTTSE